MDTDNPLVAIAICFGLTALLSVAIYGSIWLKEEWQERFGKH